MILPTSASVQHETITKQAKGLTQRALCRWAEAHPASQWEANRALTAFESGAVADYSDDLGDETFTVADRCAPDGAFLAGRNWCACDPTREHALCYHALAVCLLLGYRSHYARLAAARPLRVFAVVVKKSLTVAHSHERLGDHLADVIQQNRAVLAGAK